MLPSYGKDDSQTDASGDQERGTGYSSVFGTLMRDRVSTESEQAPVTNLFGDIDALKYGTNYDAEDLSKQTSITFTQRPLGMVADQSNLDSYIVSKIVKRKQAAKLGVMVHWKIMSINGQEVSDLTREAIELKLEQAPLPLRVTFQMYPQDAERNGTIFAQIEENRWFNNCTQCMICLNALQIGWDVDYDARYHKPANLYDTQGKPTLEAFAVLENVFCIYFTAEIIVRFLAFKNKCRWYRDRWFVFDSTLVLLMVLETWVFTFTGNGGGAIGQLSILRLLRITRVIRVLRHIRELQMIVKGMKAAVRAVVWTFLLLVIITYAWAILFTNEFHEGWCSEEMIMSCIEDGECVYEDDPDKICNAKEIMLYFGSMGKSMLSLLVMGTILDDVTQCTDAIRATNQHQMLLFFILYILINSFTMMNMLVGILVEVVQNTNEGEKNRSLEEGVKAAIMRIFTEMDQDNSGFITKEEFLKMRHCEPVMESLRKLDIKEKQFDMYVELLFQPDEDGNQASLKKQDLIDCIIRLRPSTQVSALDFAAFKQSVFTSLDSMKERVGRVEEVCAELCGEIPKQGDRASENTSLPLTELAGSLPPPPPLRPEPPEAPPPQAEEPLLMNTKIDMEMLVKLDQASSGDIINELQRRLGMANLEETGVPFSMMDEDLQIRVKTAEAFQSLNGPALQ